MRFRYKPWVQPELEASPIVCMDSEKHKNNWSQFFENPELPLSLELGCGKGRFISALAKTRPSYNYLGIDMETHALIYAKQKLETEHLGNARLLWHDISKSADFFADGEASEIFINFPNPWPKKRQQKRRLTHPRQLIQYRKYLKMGGEIWFKTDDQDLYEASLIYFPLMGFEILDSTENLQSDINSDPRNIMTEYEERWRKAGIKIKAIYAKKVPADEIELGKILENFQDFARDDLPN